MPNLTQMSRLLRALRQEAKAAKPAGDLEEIMARLPKAPPEVEARVLAEIEARDRARREMYKVPEVDKTKGKKALAEARRILMTPEERAAYEAQLREQGLQRFLEPSAVKRRMYHGTNKDFSAFGHEHQYTGEGATASGSGFYFTESPESASRYALMKGIEGANVKPVYLNIKNPLHFDWGKGEVTGANINLTKKQVKEIIESAPNIRDEEYSPLTNWGDIRGKNFEKTLNEAVKSYADSSMLAALRNDFFLDDHEKWLRSLSKATGYDSATTVTPTGERHYIAWFPEQIKSATGNRGTYDITKPDITKAEGGLAQYGLRHSGEGVKGKGYFGPMAGRDGTVTELSAEDESGEYPLVVPTLTAEELDRLLAGEEPTPEMLDKASSWAATRRKRGESPFASPTELRMPRPKAEGGSVSLTDLPDEVNPSNWREHLQNNVLADARALLGVKDGGAINLDELIEKSLKKKDGGAINLDDLIAWTMAKDDHRKMKEGGAVKMQGGGSPGEVAGDMFKPKPLSIPEPITDLVEALRRQFEKEKRSMRKPGAAQDVLMRGPVAAYAGAPADIVGMGGELLDYAQKKIPALRKPASVMDTGPEKTPPMGYAPVFPLSPEGSYGTTAAQEMMGKAGLTTGEERPLFETGAMVGAPVAGYAGLKAGKALAPTAKEMLDLQLQQMMSPYQMNVIKPEGGNWIKGATQKYVEPLKLKEVGGKLSEDVLKELEEIYTPEAIAAMKPENRAFIEQRTFPFIQSRAAINRFIDKKLAKYIQNEMGTPSDPVRIQADAWAKKQQTLLADKQKQIDKVRADIEKARQERNVDPEVLTRSQARLRELQKEKDLIKNRRGLHFNIVDAEIRGEAARVMRAEQGLPEVNTAQSPTGKLWEDTSDYTIRRSPYFEQVPFDAFEEMASVPRPERQARMAEINKAELEKLGGEFAVQNPSELAYSLNRGMPARMLGFEHLTDELHNALQPNELPEYLRLTPKTLDKMSVPQVVEHVDKINAWRASQKAEVDKARAANAATVVHKEYPEQGLKWVELKMPNFNSLPLEERKAMIERLREEAKQQGLSPESYIEKYPERMLEDALKYEGEILQHCVGGYCPDVVEGRSRIFSLRDEDGRPHATIEVEPTGYWDVFKNLPIEQKDEINAVLEKWLSNIDYTPNSEELVAKSEQVMAQLGYKPKEQISQIKGLQNKKPEAEFIPYIQDFVKSGEWSHVGDIHHADLRQARDVFGPTEVETLRGRGRELGEYLTPAEIEELQATFKPRGMKRGGRITKADLEREYRMAFGGGVFNTDPDITDSGRIIPEHTI